LAQGSAWAIALVPAAANLRHSVNLCWRPPMSVSNATVTDPVALAEVSATRDRPSNKQNVRVISNGLHASEAQGSTSGSELGTVTTSAEAACGKKAKRKSRLCNGKRERYRKFKEQLKNIVMTAPHLMDAHSIAWPPSLQKDAQKQQWLMEHFTMCKLQQLKIQGEPCMIDPALSRSSLFEMPL